MRMDPYAEMIAADWDAYWIERGSVPNHTAEEEASDAAYPRWVDGSESVRHILHGSMPEQYPWPTISRADAIAYLREAARRQEEQLEDTEIAEMAR